LKNALSPSHFVRIERFGGSHSSVEPVSEQERIKYRIKIKVDVKRVFIESIFAKIG